MTCPANAHAGLIGEPAGTDGATDSVTNFECARKGSFRPEAVVHVVTGETAHAVRITDGWII